MSSIFRILAELAILATIISFIVYIPEIFPRCNLCKKIKFRWQFSLHTDISLSLSRKGNQSVCKKCCLRENINNFSDLHTKKEIKNRVEYKTKSIL